MSIIKKHHLLAKYKELDYDEDFFERFFLISDPIISRISINPTYGALFLFYIQKSVENFDAPHLQQIINTIQDQQGLINQEVQELSYFCSKIQYLVDVLNNIDQNPENLQILINLENYFVENNAFIAGLELASSFILMQIINNKYQNPQEKQIYHSIIFSQLNNQPMSIHEAQITEICKLFEINCSVYFENLDPQALILKASPQNQQFNQQNQNQNLTEFSLLLCAQESQIKIGYNMTETKYKQIWEENLFCRKDQVDLIQTTLVECMNLKDSDTQLKYQNAQIKELKEQIKQVEEQNEYYNNMLSDALKQVSEFKLYNLDLEQQLASGICEFNKDKTKYTHFS